MTVIGLTTYSEPAQMLVWQREFAMLHATYVAATERAGGIAVLLPPQGAGADEVLDRVDGLVLTGGADVDPQRYGEAPAERTSRPRVLRDEWESALTRAALDRDMPLLAICRGLQILNVALGGSLHQHLPEVTGHEGHQPAPGVFGAVDVNVAPGTRTAEVIGPRVRVSCHHHQALARLAPGLEVTGRAGDGTAEAVEVPGRAFAVGCSGTQKRAVRTSGSSRHWSMRDDGTGTGSDERSPPAASTSQPELDWPLAGETGLSQRAIVAGKALAHQAIPTGRSRS